MSTVTVGGGAHAPSRMHLLVHDVIELAEAIAREIIKVEHAVLPTAECEKEKP